MVSPTITRKATSVSHRAAIFRDENTPRQSEYNNSTSILRGSEAIRKERARFPGATVTALRGRASVVAKTRPHKAVTVAPKFRLSRELPKSGFSDSLSVLFCWHSQTAAGHLARCQTKPRSATGPVASRHPSGNRPADFPATSPAATAETSTSAPATTHETCDSSLTPIPSTTNPRPPTAPTKK